MSPSKNRLNIDPSTIFCRDNLEVLQGINSDSIDLIYLDPPFNKKKEFTAPIGTAAEGASFNDIFREEDIKIEMVHAIRQESPQLFNLLNSIGNLPNRYNYCYCVYMAVRLIEMRRVLKDTGSLYLHCDQTMSHYLKLLLDCIFGEQNFGDEIVWSYGKYTNAAKHYQKNHDVILWYCKQYGVHRFNKLFVKSSPNTQKDYDRGYRRHKPKGTPQLLVYNKEKAISEIEKAKNEGLKIVYREGKTTVALPDVWHIPIIGSTAKERTGYPTQKPLALLERIIQASSNEGDVVLDPFCGCATTCVAAEKLSRKWIGVDISNMAYELVKQRLEREVPADLLRREPKFRTTLPKRNKDDLMEKRYVYIISHPKYPEQYKVGIATNPKTRLGQYQTSDPNKQYKLEYKYESIHFREIEKYIHDKFNAEGEWVKDDMEVIKKEIGSWSSNNLI